MSSSSSSARIQITQGLSSFTNSTPYGDGVDRSMPVILTGRMNVNEWNNICDQVDNIVLPLNKLRYIIFGAIALFAISLVSFWGVDALLEHLELESDMNFIILWSVSACAGNGVVATIFYAHFKTRKAFLDVKHVCEINSQKYADKLISFDLRNDEIIMPGNRGNTIQQDRYILVSIISNPDADVEYRAGGGGAVIGDFTSPSLPPVVEAFGFPLNGNINQSSTNTNTTINTTTTIEGRLIKLEQIKHMISATEYNEKKKEIVSSEV